MSTPRTERHFPSGNDVEFVSHRALGRSTRPAVHIRSNDMNLMNEDLARAQIAIRLEEARQRNRANALRRAVRTSRRAQRAQRRAEQAALRVW